MDQFKPTTSASLPTIEEPVNKESKFWHKAFEPAQIVKEYGLISSLDLNKFNNDLLVSSLSRISIYNICNLERKSYSSLTQYNVYRASYRKSDCLLFTSSTEEGVINVFDVNNSKPLRQLSIQAINRHLRPVHSTEFIDNNKIVSFSDDKHIKIWDVATGDMLQDVGAKDETSSPHQDYIRTGCTISSGSNFVCSGSYDHFVKIWDTRDKSHTPFASFNCGAPVESVIHRKSLIIASAGKSVKVYDIFAGKIINSLVDIHSKTITCLYDYEGRLLTGSLDGHIKIYDNLFKLITSLSYVPAQVFSMCVNQKAIVIGMEDGHVNLKRLKSKDRDEKINFLSKSHLLSSSNNRYFRWGPEDNNDMDELNDSDTVMVKKERKKHKRLRSFDRQLKKYNHSEALDVAMKRWDPFSIVSLIQELSRRKMLEAALGGREYDSLRKIGMFVIEYIRDPRFSRILVDVAILLCDIYSRKVDYCEEMKAMFGMLNKKVEKELKLMKEMMTVSGQIDLIISNA